MLVAVPLVPFAEAYHVINDTDGKAKKQLEVWRAQFDPVYAERTKLISARSAKIDAESFYNQGIIAFFPSVPSNGVYSGLKYERGNSDYKKNQQIISANESLKSLQDLMADDPLHTESAGWRYHSEILEQFRATAFDFKVEFNQRMSELSGRHSPSKKTNKDT